MQLCILTIFANILVLVTEYCLCQQNYPIVTVRDGQLRGYYFKSRDHRKYSGFLGIPYAKPPIRFQLSEPPEPWVGIRNALSLGSPCVQQPGIGNEDCLTINVHSPNTDGRLPVLVFIHGGAFKRGGSIEHLGQFFMDEDVVLVTLNYRFGALGFLSTGDGEVEANLGLKDQLLALQWVQSNIAAFGGDPQKVTIFGESAGAACIHYHVLYPASRGLFSQAILQSGVANNPWSLNEYPRNTAMALGTAMGCNATTSRALIECLMQKSPYDIMKEELLEWHMDPLVQFSPTMDPPGSKIMFITENPLTLLESGNFTKVPMIFTMCESEGVLFHSAMISKTLELNQQLNEDYLRIFPLTNFYFNSGYSESQKDYMSQQIRNFYYGNSIIGADSFNDLLRMYNDRWFFHGIQKALILHAKHHTVFNGIFAYKGNISLANIRYGYDEYLGVSHADDLFYFFNRFYNVILNPANEAVSKTFVKMWANFATNGNPGFTFDGITWEPFDPNREDPTWLEINFPPAILDNPFKQRFQFWDDLLENVKTK